MTTNSPGAERSTVPTGSGEVEAMAKTLHECARSVFGTEALASCLGFNVQPGLRARWQAFVSILSRDPVVTYGETPAEALGAAEREIKLCSADNIAAVLGIGAPTDPRGPDYSREGRQGRGTFFVHHNCYRCKDGLLPCLRGVDCDYPSARND